VAFGGLAFVVAVVGLYGVVSHSVTQRMHEVGVRVALGARGGDVVRLVVVQGVRPIVVAVSIGLAVAWAIAPRVQPLLFKQSAVDVAMYAVVGAVGLIAIRTFDNDGPLQSPLSRRHQRSNIAV